MENILERLEKLENLVEKNEERLKFLSDKIQNLKTLCENHKEILKTLEKQKNVDIFLTDKGDLIEISGNTIPIKEELKENGARWFAKGKCWSFRERSYDEVKDILQGIIETKNLNINLKTN